MDVAEKIAQKYFNPGINNTRCQKAIREATRQLTRALNETTKQNQQLMADNAAMLEQIEKQRQAQEANKHDQAQTDPSGVPETDPQQDHEG